jgi:UrcA family protein
MKMHTGMALMIAAAAAVASAAVPDEGPDSVAVDSTTVRFDAAEVVDSKSAGRLFYRIRRAAEEVCRIASFPRGYEMWEEHACEVDAVAEAVRDVDLPALDRYFYRGSGPMLATRN